MCHIICINAIYIIFYHEEGGMLYYPSTYYCRYYNLITDIAHCLMTSYYPSKKAETNYSQVISGLFYIHAITYLGVVH